MPPVLDLPLDRLAGEDPELEPTTDILAELGSKKGSRIVVGFAAETTDALANARKKLESKSLDAIVLNDVSLSIEPGKCIVVIGASGTGKSVLLKHIVGLLQPDTGEVWFTGQRIDTLTERKLMEVRQHFGFLFQMGALFDSLNVLDNVAFPLTEHTKKSREEIVCIAQQKLALVGLPDVGTKMPAELSGGQKKRVALARAIALDPEVILYDEPTTGLDPIRADVINELIVKLQTELKVTSSIRSQHAAAAKGAASRHCAGEYAVSCSKRIPRLIVSRRPSVHESCPYTPT